MKYVSIDLETTGLYPGQILQFAAVLDDLRQPEVPVEELPCLNLLVDSLEYSGQPYALWLNGDLLQELAKDHDNGTVIALRGHNAIVTEPHRITSQLTKWLADNNYDQKKLVCAGKNFAGFDLKFLEAVNPDFAFDCRLHHRSLDVGLAYLRPDDTEPPSMAECCRRAGLNDTVTHDAVDDARLVIKLIRRFMQRYTCNFLSW